MSADTNLHRTFDYQLSPAPLRIIDWAPVKSVAASVLQSGPNLKAYTIVDTASPNEAAAAAAFAQQEGLRREAARVHRHAAGGSISGAAEGATPTNADHDTSDAVALSSGLPVSGLVAAPADATLIAAASPYYTPGATAAEWSEGRLTDDGTSFQSSPQHQQQQRSHAESWTGVNTHDVAATASPGGLLYFPYGATPAPAGASSAAAGGGPVNTNALVAVGPSAGVPAGAATVALNGATPTSSAVTPTTTTMLIPIGDTTGVPALTASSGSGLAGGNMNTTSNHNSANHLYTNNNSRASGHSGTATPKAGGAGTATGATPRPRSPLLPSTSSPAAATGLARYSHQWGTAGTMYGFDTVYQNGSFGVLLGLFTGVGYQQTNIFYRQEETYAGAGEGGGGKAGFSGSAAGGGAAATAAAATANGGSGSSNPASASNSVNNRSPSEHNSTTLPAPGASSATDGLADGAGANTQSNNNNNGSGGGGGAGAVSAAATGAINGQHGGVGGKSSGALGSAADAPRTRLGPVVAYKNRGGFQISNAIQCFWYWGAKRWTGVFNLRFTPLLSGDAILPVCECVMRTEITENSILIDDPVVYIHSFVVMLGRRKRTPDDALSLTEDTTKAGADRSASKATTTAEDAAENAVPSLVHGAAAASAGEKTNSTKEFEQQKHNSKTGQAAAVPSSKSSPLSLTSASASEQKDNKSAPLSDRSTRFERSSTPSPTMEEGKPGVPQNNSNTKGSTATQSAHHDTAATTKTTKPSSPSSAKPTDSTTAERCVKGAVDKGDDSSSTEAAKMPSWYYWYQRCMVDTSDEWLWSRAAAEVAADAARSTTPWWRLQHVKTGVGLSYRYRKPRGINVYWGWSAQLGRGTALSGHVDVLRRMSCSISSSFGYLDLSVRLRANLVTLHQTALDAGLCWRPLPHVPEFAVRLATSANGTTLGVEVADVAPYVYAPLVEKLAHYRAGKQQGAEGEAEAADVLGVRTSTDALSRQLHGNATASPTGAAAPATTTAGSIPSASSDGVDAAPKEDLVGLLPVTWHYLCGFGSTITHAYAGVAGAIANTWHAKSAAPPSVDSGVAAASMASVPQHSQPQQQQAQQQAQQGMGLRVSPHHPSMPEMPTTPNLTAAPPLTSSSPFDSTRAAVARVSGAVLPAGRATLQYVNETCRYVADLGWLETMLRTSHVNVSMGVTAEPGKLARDWSFFLIFSEK